MVQQEAYIKKAEEPGTGRCTRLVKNGVCSGLDCLKTMFSRVLVLLVWLTLPVPNE